MPPLTYDRGAPGSGQHSCIGCCPVLRPDALVRGRGVLMEQVQEEQLFGSPPGELQAVALTVLNYESGRYGFCLSGHASMRRRLMTLRCITTERGEIPTMVRVIAPIIERTARMSVRSFQQHAWAAHNRLGFLGYEVEIQGCGKEPHV